MYVVLICLELLTTYCVRHRTAITIYVLGVSKRSERMSRVGFHIKLCREDPVTDAAF